MPAGTYYLGMVLDITNAVDEVLETNNRMYDADTITIGPPLIPVPPSMLLPTDTNADGKHDDVNGNSRGDFAGAVWLFNNL
jgi:hypothetical protein